MKIVVFSDLDATLLDAQTYSWKPADTAIDALRKRDAALVMVTSKTLSEVGSLHKELGFDDPFIFENGGGIGVPKHSSLRSQEFLSWEPGMDEFEMKGFSVFGLGARYDLLVKSLAEISGEVGVPLVGFSSMSDEDVANASGLLAGQAGKARMRLFDEPFVIPQDFRALEPEIRHAAHRRGLNVEKGGRFWHLIGHAGKGKAVSIVLKAFRGRYGELVSLGLGDSPNDFSFLEVVDIPVVLGTAPVTEHSPLLGERARRYDAPGPRGWNRAVLDILRTI